MNGPDWKKIAADRLAQLRRLERRDARIAADLHRSVGAALRRAIHGGCLASLSDERVVALVDSVARQVAEDFRLPDPAVHEAGGKRR